MKSAMPVTHSAPSLPPALLRLFERTPTTLGHWVRAIAFDGGLNSPHPKMAALPIWRTENTAGFNYAIGHEMRARIRIGLTRSGYWVIQHSSSPESGVVPAGWHSHFYGMDGRLCFSEGPSSHLFRELPKKNFEPACPVLNFLYTALWAETQNAGSGEAHRALIRSIESLLGCLPEEKIHRFSFPLASKDPALLSLDAERTSIERDPHLTREEREAHLAKIKVSIVEFLRLKRRAHGSRAMRPGRILFRLSLLRFARTLKTRPAHLLKNLLDRLILDPLRWFGGVVRSNLGYSVALAIYSPFTFFFITQPMNPHAMRAVGAVRNAILAFSENTEEILGLRRIAPLPIGNPGPLAANHSGPLLTDWEERMSRFKAMQISYEASLPLASRLGRLEEMETQLNWPLILEGAWRQTLLLNQNIDALENSPTRFPQSFRTFLREERKRTEELLGYFFERNVRFILDHANLILDPGREQEKSAPRGMAALTLFQEMRQEFKKRDPDRPPPTGAQEIESIPGEGFHWNPGRAESGILDAEGFRRASARNWETLYLLQSRTQEAALSGLQLYTWSVRSAVQLLERLSSEEREELPKLEQAFKKSRRKNPASSHPDLDLQEKRIDLVTASLVREFKSVRPEIETALKDDSEARDRARMIEGVLRSNQARKNLLKEAGLGSG